MPRNTYIPLALVLALCLIPLAPAAGQEPAIPLTEEVETVEPPLDSLRESVAHAVSMVKPALVRIHVVTPHYRSGREEKYESSGSGVVIRPEGYVITNHHVAGKARSLKVVFADKSEYAAELVGTDPLTDIAVIKLVPEESDASREFPVAEWGDSSELQQGDHVLAMGSPLALSQSVTLGVISNTEMIMPEWMSRYGGLELEGENVGALVRWIAHDAQIHGGNSGGPLVNLRGLIVGINEISMGLAGAIPGNLARAIADSLIEEGQVRRAWLGLQVQPRLKHDEHEEGILVAGAYKDSPAEMAGFESGDLLLSINDETFDVRFGEQLPGFNRFITELPIGEKAEAVVLRDGERKTITVTPVEREAWQPDQHELKQWGITARDLSYFMAQEMKRENADGVLVTSLRPGGPASDAKPTIQSRDILLRVDGEAVNDIEDLRRVTRELTRGAEEPVPALVEYERNSHNYVTVVEVGIEELRDPALDVKKAWLPVETQVITREIAENLDDPDLTGFRITHVYDETTAAEAGLEVGDYILEVDGEKMTASQPEHYEELDAWIRQYKVGTEAELLLLRDGERKTLGVELMESPPRSREMKKYRNEDFEFTVRNITFFDKADEKWKQEQAGVMVDEVQPGSWAALGGLSVGDLILSVEDTSIRDVEEFEAVMERITEEKPEEVVFQVKRRIENRFVELEPEWEDETKG